MQIEEYKPVLDSRYGNIGKIPPMIKEANIIRPLIGLTMLSSIPILPLT